MQKLTFCLVTICLCLAACHTRKNQPAFSAPIEQQVIDAAPTAIPADTVKTVQLPSDLPTSQNQSNHSTTPTPSVSLSDVSQTGTVTQHIPTTTSTTPATDRPVFEDEKLIDTNQRLLHPYTALTPDPTAVQQAPWAYEQLKYGIYYGFIKAGTAYIRNRGVVNIDGHSAYLIQTSAFSASVIDAVFKVRDINYSWLDATHFYSYGYGQSVREGNYKRDEWVQFDYPHKQYIGQIQQKKEPKHISGPLDIQVLDMLSALYYVRSQSLEIGKDLVFDIINREKQYPLLVKVLKKEKVKTSAGKFDCIVVEPQIRGEGIFVAKGKSLKVWLTDDAYKMPVKMSVEVFIGSVSAELLEYKRQAPTNIL